MKMDWIIKLIKLLWSQVSPQLRELIVSFVKTLEEKAKETENEWDDLAISILKMILGIS